MGLALPAPSGGTSVPFTEAERKRRLVVDMLLQPFPLNNERIAEAVGVDPSTVCRINADLKRRAVDEVLKDGRCSNGRKPVYSAVWSVIEALKKAYPSAGGQELWAILRADKGFDPSELPTPVSINSYLSNKRMVHRRVTGKSDFRRYLRVPPNAPLVEVGMDECLGFETKGGVPFKVVSVKDGFSGAVYSEPFLYDPRGDPAKANNQRTFAGTFFRFAQHIGIPQTLVLDNGAGQIINSGWLPQVARQAVRLGTVVEWEPPATPWKNGAIEKWNDLIYRWWIDHRGEYSGVEQAFSAIRERALWYTLNVPLKKHGWKPAVHVVPVKPWPFGGPEAGPVKLDRIENSELGWPGTVRLQRTVRENGLVILHEPDALHVSDALVGGFVRVTMHVNEEGGVKVPFRMERAR